MPQEEILPSTLSVPSDPQSLSVVRAFVEAVCQAREVDRTTIHAVVLATSEAVTNIVRHAHREIPGSSFQLECHILDTSIEVILTDQGQPFHLEEVPQLNPGELRVGGRGVYLMRTLMDEVACETLGERGNRLRLMKRRSPPHEVRDCG